MALLHGYSRKTMSRSIRKMLHEGYPREASVRAAKETALISLREAARHPMWLELQRRRAAKERRRAKRRTHHALTR